MKDKKKQYELAIAALFHDIGKFKQRAFGGDEKYLMDETLKLEAIFLPKTNYDLYSHRHALWTYDFFVRDFFKIIHDSDNDFLNSINIGRIAKLAALHHRPDESDSQIIAEADRYSAGNDRAYSEESYVKGEYLKKPLRSIFSSINYENKEGSSSRSNYSYLLKRISEKDAMFPIENRNAAVEDYKNLYTQFIDCLSESIVEISDYEMLLAKLKDILYEFTWCIPSATNDYLNDISLYDHSVTTMAIAIALFNNENQTSKISICAFNVSGIQSFIFQSKYASFKNAAKIFRGRSFIVAAFSAAMKRKICEKIGIIPFVDIRDAGGGMTLLLPDSEEIKPSLDVIQTECEEFLFQKYFGALSFCLWFEADVSPDVFGKGKYIDFNKSISEHLASRKLKKFSYLIDKGLSPVLPFDGNKVLCEACGKHGCDADSLCDICKSELSLGTDIPHGMYFSISDVNGEYEILPNMYLKISDSVKYLDSRDTTWSLGSNDSSRYPVWRLNNYTPDCDFSEIAKSAVSEEGRGKPFLAYIKIDVDNLGKLVSKGLPKNEYSISRFSTFSRSLHFFFNTHIYDLLENEYPNIYTVLSGGDDLFVIAPWNQAIELVDRIKKDFSIFCCNNSDLHFSAGIVIAKPKEPFALVNKRANEALDTKAKEFEGKNAISYFDAVFSLNELDDWLAEYKKFREYIRVDDDENKPIMMGFLYRLYQYVSDRFNNSSLGQKYGMYSKLHYDIARNLISDNEKNKDKCTEVADYVLNKLNNYNSEKELIKFKILLIQAIYESRETRQEDVEWLLN